MANVLQGGSVVWQLEGDASGLEHALRSGSKGADKFAKDLDRKGKEAANRLKADIDEAAGRIEARFDTARRVVTASLVGIGAAVAAAGVASIKLAGDFERSLNVLGSVTQATGDQMKQLGALASELGRDMTLPGVSAGDAAEAMTELGKAGIAVNDILTASKGVLQAAKAGNIGVAESAAIVAQALNAFKLPGKDATKVADLLAGAANASAFSIHEMGLALSQSSAVAKLVGVPLSDATTALTALGNAGLQASDAGTSLKGFFLNISPNSAPAIAAMKNLKLTFFDSAGSFVGVREASARLKTALGDLSEQQKITALNTIFGSDAARSAAILADLGAAGFDKLSGAVNRQGAASELAAAQNAGFNGALDQFKSTAETLGIELGTKLLPPLTSFLRQLSDDLPRAVDFVIQNGETLIRTLGLLAGAFVGVKLASFIADLRLAGLSLTTLLGRSNVGGFRAFSSGFGVARQGARGFAEELGGVATATTQVATKMGARGLLGVVGRVAAGFGPWGLAIGAASLGAEFLIGKIDEMGEAQADASGETKELVGSLDLLKFANEKLAKAQDKVADATKNYQRAVDQVEPTSKALGDQQQRLADKQEAVNKALSDFGQNSPQYRDAVSGLEQAQFDLAKATNESANATLGVTAAFSELETANNDWAEAVKYNTELQKIQRDGLSATVEIIKDFGPEAAGQIGALNNLGLAVDRLIGKYPEISSKLQAALTNAELQLQGIGSSIDKLQNQGTNLGNQLQGAKSNIQGTTGTAPVKKPYDNRAQGGPVSAGSLYKVGERGMEWFVPEIDGEIIPMAPDVVSGADNRSAPRQVVINEYNTFNKEVDMERHRRDQQWRLANI